MNRFQSLRTAVVLLVMGIMSLTSFILCAVLFIFNIVGDLQWTPIILTLSMLLVSIVIGTGMAMVFAKRFLKPIDGLIQATKQIGQGDFSVRIEEDPDRTGEMHELVHSFNLMANELESIELYRSDFINNFSHEFKTPIVSIRGFAKQLKNQDIPEEQKKEYLDIIIKESEKLCNMSGNVLQISKLENQTMVTDKTHFYLDEQIRNCILLLEHQWVEKEIDWDLQLPDTPYFGNADLLSQVWKNLLENAIKFVGTGGKIGVHIHPIAHGVAVQVFDNGCGMTAETLNHIFEKFYQGDVSHTKQGNGLGLAIVKRIVDLCDGSISVESHVGHGTLFTLVFPVIPNESSSS
jgi:signal transduction histidine kinase